MKFLLLFLTTSVFATDPKPNQNVYTENIEIINQHLQQNYYLKINKNIVLTGQIVKENDKSIDRKTYTNLKIEF